VVQRIRIRYAKRGRLRFTSHRDFARAFERALRRARVPMAYSAGFSPHPKISYVGASPTGLASEAEYLEIGLASRMDPAALLAELDAALPPGLDLLAAVEGGTGHLADLIDASHWVLELPGVPPAEAERAVAEFLAAGPVFVEKLTKNGRREVDCRAAVARLALSPRVSDPTRTGAAGPESNSPYAILELVVRHVTPVVRPDDVLAGLRSVAGLTPPEPPRATRMAQGLLEPSGDLTDPLAVVDDKTSVAG
jgi:radical SAM-linked protein